MNFISPSQNQDFIYFPLVFPCLVGCCLLCNVSHCTKVLRNTTILVSCQVFWVWSGDNAGSFQDTALSSLHFPNKLSWELLALMPLKFFGLLGREKECKIHANNSYLFAKTIDLGANKNIICGSGMTSAESLCFEWL